MRVLLFLFLASFLGSVVRAAEPAVSFKANDVIAFVGGQDMVVASELGYLEALLQSEFPDLKLRFRSLAWEGDTVFEQRRDLNYPTLETQLEKMGATLVVAQFGVSESIQGMEKGPEFLAAYEKLIGRLAGGEKRRVVLLPPHRLPYLSVLPAAEIDRRNEALVAIELALDDLAKRTGARATLGSISDFLPAKAQAAQMHLTAENQLSFALLCFGDFAHAIPGKERAFSKDVTADAPIEKIRQLVVAKNRLWYDYSRPQNWAFLAGDRTTQPSSRDHLDPKKRWFPEELEKFVPLIEAKEKEIWEAAAKFK